MRQAIARRAKQHIALILVYIHAAQQLKSARAITRWLHARVVTACNKLRVDLLCVVMQLAKLQPIVAAHAWVRRAAGVVLANKVINDAPEVLLEVHHIERDVELGSNQSRIGSVIDRTAPLMPDLE